jgi:Tfp pilus assembly protein PilO
MKVTDKAIVFGVLVGVLAIGFYLMVLAPKRQKASELNDQIDQLNASISQQQQVASFAEDARKDFPRYYGRLVVLGKAVPQQADTGSMLVQLNTIAGDTHVDFRSIALGGDSASAGTGSSATSTPTASAASNSTAAPAGTSTTPATGTTGTTGTTAGAATAGTSSTTSTAAAAPVPATESAAASLPIGAVVGPAGLATLPYNMTFRGGYFDIANFIGGVDDLVQPTASAIRVTPDGRLFTVDGFAISGGLPGSSPKLKANFAVTTYATPADQGLTLGASPSGPAPAVPGTAQAQPASAVVAK